jgi:Fic family protein
MEPMLVGESSPRRARLNELVFELTAAANAFKASLPDGILEALSDLVRRHIAVSPGAVPRFLERWETAYCPLSKFETVLQAAAAHHRLLWIHPFADGNGRVARLVSYAMLLKAFDTGGIWSIARGLGRDVDAYKGHVADCDLMRRNDLDCRGTLSEVPGIACSGADARALPRTNATSVTDSA